jgi:hypothetical protein
MRNPEEIYQQLMIRLSNTMEVSREILAELTKHQADNPHTNIPADTMLGMIEEVRAALRLIPEMPRGTSMAVDVAMTFITSYVMQLDEAKDTPSKRAEHLADFQQMMNTNLARYSQKMMENFQEITGVKNGTPRIVVPK